MTSKEFQYVLATIDNEGFDYSFSGYTNFKEEVKDPYFHKLRRAYLNARDELAKYVGIEEFSCHD